MPDPVAIDRERELVLEIDRLVAQRVRAEAECEKLHRAGSAAAQRDAESRRNDFESRHAAAIQANDSTRDQTTEAARQRFESDKSALKNSLAQRQTELVRTTETEESAARKTLDEKVWIAETLYEANESKPRLDFEQTRKDLSARSQDLDSAEAQGSFLFASFKHRPRPPHAAVSPPPGSEPAAADPAKLPSQADFDRCRTEAFGALSRLAGMVLPRAFRTDVALVIWLALVGAMGAGALWWRGWKPDEEAVIAVSVAAVLLGVLIGAIARMVRLRVGRVAGEFVDALAGARAAYQRCLAEAAQRRDRHAADLLARRDADVASARTKFEPVIADARRRRDEGQRALQDEYARGRADLAARLETELTAANRAHDAAAAATSARHDSDLAEAQRDLDQRLADAAYRRDDAWRTLESHWKEGLTRVYASVDNAAQLVARLFPAWDQPVWDRWSPPRDEPPAVPYAHLRISLADFPGGISADPRLAPARPAAFDLPAMLSLPDRLSLVLRTDERGRGDNGREQAVRTLQALMLRLITAFPSGKVRFTIFDPVGLGQSFAGFMHLADYDDALVTGKIWTEARHIEQRLADLTEHMENVIQKYLRNEFSTITEYNRQAGELAEPHRFLVIADFPVNFTEPAARRLASIVSSGARCGVHTLMAIDARQSLPQGVQRDDIESGSARLAWHDTEKRFVRDDPALARLPLTLLEPPPEDRLTSIVHAAGEAAKDSRRVQVRFDTITPAPEDEWSGDTAEQLRVPLGRAGATKLQYLELGRGTSQHALIAGKTGSGKSTLLHALITNLSLWYSPDQIEFYLVDFKKGVEFKTYATHELPHARAVAIESDREFGLSVLQRLDGELKRRGNVYRDLRVQDLAGYRKALVEGRQEAVEAGPLPRTLLIIDEFQEFFVEDDRLAQEAALLMDRLVRQGRAFGIHVLLGSQTLSGAYSLARSTMGQMAVRIVLQCSEADSYLILSEDNSAARLLGRPGEAIFNDHGGLVEGNSPFQIAWVPDEAREKCLKRVETLARQHAFKRPAGAERQAVFEGNIPADIARNYLLDAYLRLPREPETAAAPLPTIRAFLGEPIAIKDPTSAVFRRAAASNLLIVGQREEPALAMFASTLVSLAAQVPAPASNGPPSPTPPLPRFWIIDGTPQDEPTAAYLRRLAAAVAGGAHPVRLVGPRDIPDAAAQLTAELDRRQQNEHASVAAGPLFILVFALHKLRALKRNEDDFGFSSSSDEKAPAPDKQFAALLRDGPPLGIHTILWCDTASSLTRALDRQGLKEFDYRVLFQMSAADSTALIDTPDAGKLGLHRALLFSEELGLAEKFRPYSLPSEEWLQHAHRCLAPAVARAPNP